MSKATDEIATKVATQAQSMVDAALEGIAEGFEAEPTMNFTGGEVARMVRSTALNTSRKIRADLGLLPLPVEEGRPE